MTGNLQADVRQSRQAVIVRCCLSVAIALLDAQKKAIPVYAKSGLFASSEKFNKKADDIVCLVIPTGTIDGKLTTALNGTESVLIKL